MQPRLTSVRILVYGVLAVALLCVLNAWLFLPLTPEDRSSLGEMFGGLDALFSGCALVGAFLAVYYQHKELLAQGRQILEAARAQVEATRALEKQMRLSTLRARIEARSILISSAYRNIGLSGSVPSLTEEKRLEALRLRIKQDEASLSMLVSQLETETE